MQIAVRLPERLLRRVDAHAERLREETPEWVVVTRADAVRALLLEALPSTEADNSVLRSAHVSPGCPAGGSA